MGSRPGMEGISFRRLAMGMAGRELFVHHFDDLRVDGPLAEEGPDDGVLVRQEGHAVFQAHLPVFRPGIGSERRKQGDMFVMEAFHDGSGFGIGRAAVDPIAQKDEIIAARSAGAWLTGRHGVPAGRAPAMAWATFFVFPVRDEYKTSVRIVFRFSFIVD